MDKAFAEFADWTPAQHSANGPDVKRSHSKVDRFAWTFCPVHRDFGVPYQWSMDQCAYAADVVFKRQADLPAIDGTLTRTAIHTEKSDNTPTFLG